MGQRFYKYQGTGNDFIMIDNRTQTFSPTTEYVAALCHRRTGIGADGLILATMCGNGGRCIALFAHHLGIGGLLKTFNGVDGVHQAEILSADATQGEVRLQMIDVHDPEIHPDYLFLNTGSPHYVTFIPDVRAVDVFHEGTKIRRSAQFAPIGGTNVNFVEILSDGHIRIRTFERGVEDETLACGTGATASALATAIHTHSSCRNFRVDVEGGTLWVSFESSDLKNFDHIFLTGPARKVFFGKTAEIF